MDGWADGQIKKNELSWKFKGDNIERLIFTGFSSPLVTLCKIALYYCIVTDFVFAGFVERFLDFFVFFPHMEHRICLTMSRLLSMTDEGFYFVPLPLKWKRLHYIQLFTCYFFI